MAYFKALLKYLVVGDLKAKYKNKFLGVIWAVLDPLVMMAIYVFLIKYIFNRGGEYYPVELLSGLVFYRWFSLTSMNSSRILVSSSKMLQTVRLPIKVLPLSRVVINAVDMLIGLVLLIILLFVFGKMPTIQWLWIIPLIALEFAFLYAISIVFSIVGVYFRDLLNILQFAVRILLYASPILYSIEQIPAQYQSLYYTFSPFASLIQSFKNVLVYETAPTIYIFVFLAYTLVFLGLAEYLVKSKKNIAKDL